MTFLTLFFLILGFYSYFLYPLILISFFPKKNPLEHANNLEKSINLISIIISARNEEKIIRKKIQDTLEIVKNSKFKNVEILVASDASEDLTDSIVGEFNEIKLVRNNNRGGKEEVQKLAVSISKGDIILFTDAKIIMNPESVDVVIESFSNSEIGAISSIDRVISVSGTGSGESMYVNYEMKLREIESTRLSLVGLSGSCFAVRREIAEKMRGDIPSDFSLMLETIRVQKRGVLQPRLIGSYTSVKDEEEEFKRKVRTILRGITAFFQSSEILNIRTYGIFTWQIISHKLMRWLSPFFLILALLTALIGTSSICNFVAISGIATLVLALIAFLEKDLRGNLFFKVPLFFSVVNLAILVAWWRFLSGSRQVLWDPSNKI